MDQTQITTETIVSDKLEKLRILDKQLKNCNEFLSYLIQNPIQLNPVNHSSEPFKKDKVNSQTDFSDINKYIDSFQAEPQDTADLHHIDEQLTKVLKKRETQLHQQRAIEMHKQIKAQFSEQSKKLIDSISSKGNELEQINKNLIEKYNNIVFQKYSKYRPNYMKSAVDTLIVHFDSLASTIEDLYGLPPASGPTPLGST